MLSSETTVSTKIDWLSVTVISADYPKNWTTKRQELKRGMNGYDTGLEYLDGRIELCSSTRPDMLTHIQLSGSCIDRLCTDHNLNSADIAKVFFDGRCTRLDIAIDVRKGELDIKLLNDQFIAGKVVTKAKSGLYLKGARVDGETLYIGAPKSNRRIRIYDKAAEQKLIDENWTRIEYQARHREAERIFFHLSKCENILQEIPKLINGFVSFPKNNEWAIVVGSDTSKPEPLEGHASNRKVWLLDTAVKALASEMLSSGESYELLSEFINMTRKEYKSKMSNFHG